LAVSFVTLVNGMTSAHTTPAAMPEMRSDSDSRRDAKAVLFLLITLGLAALELWGLIRLF
jgi:hypothetical protein